MFGFRFARCIRNKSISAPCNNLSLISKGLSKCSSFLRDVPSMLRLFWCVYTALLAVKADHWVFYPEKSPAYLNHLGKVSKIRLSRVFLVLHKPFMELVILLTESQVSMITYLSPAIYKMEISGKIHFINFPCRLYAKKHILIAFLQIAMYGLIDLQNSYITSAGHILTCRCAETYWKRFDFMDAKALSETAKLDFNTVLITIDWSQQTIDQTNLLNNICIVKQETFAVELLASDMCINSTFLPFLDPKLHRLIYLLLEPQS